MKILDRIVTSQIKPARLSKALFILLGTVLVLPGLLFAQDRDQAEQSETQPYTGAKAPVQADTPGEPKMPEIKMTLTSEAFEDGAVIPARYSCEGDDLSPPLSWSDVPTGTRAFALICEDPDAPVGTWDHWVIFNLPGEMTSLPAGVTTEAELGEDVRHGLNSWHRTGYGGPCPPPGKPHRYFFRLYALSAPVELSAGVTKAELLAAIKPLTLGQTELMGTFSR
jgi:Raf kinase inhibitor-like YbhB/YbcL family protein